MSPKRLAMSKTIDYGNLMHDAMRGLIQRVLNGVAKDGLPGEHHFFVTFDTMHPDVELADWLSDRYATEMTIVIQNWFDKINVADEGFAITLNFGDNPESMYIPYDAIKTFVDPSVEFGLRFETQEPDETAEANAKDETEAEMIDVVDDAPHDAEVVSLDSFRK
jgi:uncharacterized protein